MHRNVADWLPMLVAAFSYKHLVGRDVEKKKGDHTYRQHIKLDRMENADAVLSPGPSIHPNILFPFIPSTHAAWSCAVVCWLWWLLHFRNRLCLRCCCGLSGCRQKVLEISRICSSRFALRRYLKTELENYSGTTMTITLAYELIGIRCHPPWYAWKKEKKKQNYPSRSAQPGEGNRDVRSPGPLHTRFPPASLQKTSARVIHGARKRCSPTPSLAQEACTAFDWTARRNLATPEHGINKRTKTKHVQGRYFVLHRTVRTCVPVGVCSASGWTTNSLKGICSRTVPSTRPASYRRAHVTTTDRLQLRGRH